MEVSNFLFVLVVGLFLWPPPRFATCDTFADELQKFEEPAGTAHASSALAATKMDSNFTVKTDDKTATTLAGLKTNLTSDKPFSAETGVFSLSLNRPNRSEYDESGKPATKDQYKSVVEPVFKTGKPKTGKSIGRNTRSSKRTANKMGWHILPKHTKALVLSAGAVTLLSTGLAIVAAVVTAKKRSSANTSNNQQTQGKHDEASPGLSGSNGAGESETISSSEATPSGLFNTGGSFVTSGSTGSSPFNSGKTSTDGVISSSSSKASSTGSPSSGGGETFNDCVSPSSSSKASRSPGSLPSGGVIPSSSPEASGSTGSPPSGGVPLEEDPSGAMKNMFSFKLASPTVYFRYPPLGNPDTGTLPYMKNRIQDSSRPPRVERDPAGKAEPPFNNVRESHKVFAEAAPKVWPNENQKELKDIVKIATVNYWALDLLNLGGQYYVIVTEDYISLALPINIANKNDVEKSMKNLREDAKKLYNKKMRYLIPNIRKWTLGKSGLPIDVQMNGLERLKEQDGFTAAIDLPSNKNRVSKLMPWESDSSRKNGAKLLQLESAHKEFPKVVMVVPQVLAHVKAAPWRVSRAVDNYYRACGLDTASDGDLLEALKNVFDDRYHQPKIIERPSDD
eukprot:GHVT01069538.1.p1 GENE.GHVT01069538.1~~GHVT01069538.1.p1  ORF type:complete len:662 (-),score=80.14 GHVT01069538.1:221-2086(-)